MNNDIPKVGINGFGRIGRLITRALLSIAFRGKEKGRNKIIDIVAINDKSSPDILANLFEFDSFHGRFPGKVQVDNKTNELIFDDDRFKVLSISDPINMPWNKLKCDYVIESTGAFRSREGLSRHIKAGAKRVILTSTPKLIQDVDFTVVRGVNHHLLKPEHKIISTASSTMICLAPVLKIMNDTFGVDQATMTAIHSYTNDQRILDSQHTDFRRARAAMVSMVPTKTTVERTLGAIIPELNGKVKGISIRVPTPNVSLMDLTVSLKQTITQDEVENAFRMAADTKNGNPLYGIVDYEWRSLVSVDFKHNRHSAIIDFPSTMVVDNKMVKLLVWFDNEWATANRCAELIFDLWKLDQ